MDMVMWRCLDQKCCDEADEELREMTSLKEAADKELEKYRESERQLKVRHHLLVFACPTCLPRRALAAWKTATPLLLTSCIHSL